MKILTPDFVVPITQTGEAMSSLRIERFLLLGLFVLLVNPVATQAQDPADSFETLGADLRLSRDDVVRVIDLSGRRIEGRFESVSADSLNLIVDGAPRQISAPSVRQISRQRPDSILSGALIGLAAGAGGGLLAANACDYWSCGLNYQIGLLIVGPVVGGVIDALHHGHETVYAAPPGARNQGFSVSPVINREDRGVRIAFSF